MADEMTAALQALITQVSALTEKVEAQDKKYDDVYKMNSDLLTKLKGPKSADTTAKDDPDKVDWAALNKAVVAKLNPADNVDGYRKGDPIKISRTAAHDPRKYEAAKAKAEELGVALEMTDDRPSAQRERPATYQSRETDTTLIDIVDDTAQKVRWVRHDVAMGGAGLIQNWTCHGLMPLL